MILLIDRVLSVLVDGQKIAEGCRLKLSGVLTLSLYPDLLNLRIYNLSDSSYVLLKQGKEISVSNGLSLLSYGIIHDVVKTTVRSGVVIDVGFSFGYDFWHAVCSVSLNAGMSASETIRYLLAASDVDYQLLSFPVLDPIFSRPQVFYGRLSDAIISVASAASGICCLVSGGLIVVPDKSSSVDVNLSDSDIIDSPSYMPDYALFRTIPKGWPIGRRVLVKYQGREFFGLIIENEFIADTKSGLFLSQLVVRKELL